MTPFKITIFRVVNWIVKSIILKLVCTRFMKYIVNFEPPGENTCSCICKNNFKIKNKQLAASANICARALTTVSEFLRWYQMVLCTGTSKTATKSHKLFFISLTSTLVWCCLVICSWICNLRSSSLNPTMGTGNNLKEETNVWKLLLNWPKSRKWTC